MKRKVIIYGMKNDIRNGLLTTNQMKLVAPSDYTGYQLAFKLLCQANRLDAAERELEMAKKYAELSMDYYFDCMTFEIQKYQTDRDKQRYNKALTFIEEALKTLKPTSTEVIESYINAAEIYLQLEDPDKTIDCLNAAQNPAESYNLGFDVIDKEFEPVNLTEYDVEKMIEADKERIAENTAITVWKNWLKVLNPMKTEQENILRTLKMKPIPRKRRTSLTKRKKLN